MANHPEHIVSLSVLSSGKTTIGSAVISMKSKLSTHHLQAALFFAEEAKTIELGHAGPSHFDLKHRAYAMAGVIESVAFLEALVNEFFIDVQDGEAPIRAAISAGAIDQIQRLWSLNGISRLPILEKYELASVLSGRPSLKMQAGDVKTLIGLRNDLVHFQPEYQSPVDEQRKLERALLNKISGCLLFQGSRNPFFPDHCLGYDCLRWGINAVVLFADAFFDSLGLQMYYRLWPVSTPLKLMSELLAAASSAHEKSKL